VASFQVASFPASGSAGTLGSTGKQTTGQEATTTVTESLSVYILQNLYATCSNMMAFDADGYGMWDGLDGDRWRLDNWLCVD